MSDLQSRRLDGFAPIGLPLSCMSGAPRAIHRRHAIGGTKESITTTWEPVFPQGITAEWAGIGSLPAPSPNP